MLVRETECVFGEGMGLAGGVGGDGEETCRTESRGRVFNYGAFCWAGIEVSAMVFVHSNKLAYDFLV